MKLTDELLRQYAPEARDRWLETLPDDRELPPHTFSDGFLDGLAVMETQRPKRRWGPVRGLRRAAAVFFAVLLIGSVTWYGADAEARAAFFRWFRTITAGEVAYHFTGEAPEEAIPDFHCGWLPEGLEAAEVQNSGVAGDMLYRSADGAVTFLSYHYMHTGAADFLFPTEGELLHETVEVGGMSGDYYTETEEGGSSVLFWFDQEAGIAFSIQSPLPRADILRMAQSVEEGTVLAYLPEYGFTWLPEGYSCHELSRGSRARVLSCLTEDNDHIRLEYERLDAGTPAEQFGIDPSSAAETVSVRNSPAELYPDTDGDGTATLVWYDPETDIAFCLSSAGSLETLLKTAEGIARR